MKAKLPANMSHHVKGYRQVKSGILTDQHSMLGGKWIIFTNNIAFFKRPRVNPFDTRINFLSVCSNVEHTWCPCTAMPWQNGDLTISTVTEINKPKFQLIFVQLITFSNIFQYSFTIQFKFCCEFLIYAFYLVWICKVFCLYFASRDFITSK